MIYFYIDSLPLFAHRFVLQRLPSYLFVPSYLRTVPSYLRTVPSYLRTFPYLLTNIPNIFVRIIPSDYIIILNSQKSNRLCDRVCGVCIYTVCVYRPH